MKVYELMDALEILDENAEVIVAFKGDNPMEGCPVEEVLGIIRSKEGENDIVVIING